MVSVRTYEDTAVHQRINVSLSEETLRLLDHVAGKVDRSRLIDETVRYYIDEKGRSALKKSLQEGPIRRAARDLQLTEEWSPLDEEAWNEGRA
jgi:metal-responsive CopG/Arc/MetJ family transcriptional regulator